MLEIIKLSTVLCLLSVLFLCSRTAYAESSHEFDSHGYFRMAGGVSDGADVQEVFFAPGAGAKYRLGNENDNYMEFILTDTYKLDKDSPDSPYFFTEGMAVFSGKQNERIIFDNFAELFVEAGNFTGLFGSPTIWAGRRYYNRHDIHLNDYFFLNTLQGADGFGISKIDLKAGKLALAAGRYKTDLDPVAIPNGITQTNFDARFSDISVNTGGSVMLWGMYSVSTSHGPFDSVYGAAAGIMHTREKLYGGFNKFMFQYGRGLARKAGVAGADESLQTVAGATDIDELKKASTWRVTNQTLVEPHKIFSIMICGIFEKKQSTEYDKTDQTWISFGLRPIFFVSDYFRVPLEIGWDYVDDSAAGSKGSLLKATAAAEMALQRGFWTRPVLRGFFTYAAWSDKFKGEIGGPAYADKISGWTCGVQIDTSW